ncbi:Flp pilus assembly protein CpaB [Nocardioides sp. LHG3406-4]|uniref:Flp pilus assembly protein CpaB n=1 Tax=Nocardioides sp. LHG3406-4 TaxID=2804575 RepID=UPI003CF124A6
MDRRKLMLLAAVIVAALGTVLVFLYVQGADSRAAAKFDHVEVLRAVAMIEPGETIDAAAAGGKLQLQPVPADAAMQNVVSTIDDLVGEAANTRIYPGEQIITDKFGDAGDASLLPIPEGKMAISVQLTDVSRVAGFIKAGSRVSIFVNGTGKAVVDGTVSEDEPITRLLLPDVTVIAVGSTTPTAPGEGAVVEALPATILTLAVDQKEAERVIYSQQNGDLSFALRNSDSEVTASDSGVTIDNLFK